MAYKVLVVDDEEPARDLMKSYVEKLPSLELVGLADHALKAKDRIQHEQVDILLTDIQMEDLTGIDLVKSLKKAPITIFTTAYSEYALDGYALDIVDYLVKPISFSRFCKAIDKAIELIEYKEQAISTQVKQEPGETLVAQGYFFVKTNRRIVKVKYREILFVQAFGEYVKIFTQNDVLLALQSMKKMEELLPFHNFIRIHRSHILNVDHLKEVDGNVARVEDHRLVISKRMKEGFMRFLEGKGLV